MIFRFDQWLDEAPVVLLGNAGGQFNNWSEGAPLVDSGPSSTTPLPPGYLSPFMGVTEIYVDQSGGVPVDAMQESRYHKRLTGIEDRAVQVKIVNRRGRIKILGITIEASAYNVRDGFTS
jgi:hypothetical protein